MLIRISVIQFRGGAPAVNQAYIFDERGGSIGREEGNQLILRDESRVLSRVQVEVQFADGHFSLLDHGGNPSMVNGLRLGKGNSRAIYDGDIIELGEYKLRAKVIGGPNDAPAVPSADDAIGDDELDMSIHMDADFEDEHSTIVPPERSKPHCDDDAAASLPRASAPQLLAALCKGVALNTIQPLPAVLDLESMQELGGALGAALRQTIALLIEHNAFETDNSTAFRALLLRTLQEECAKLNAARAATPPAGH